jgi:hypothetical protein
VRPEVRDSISVIEMSESFYDALCDYCKHRFPMIETPTARELTARLKIGAFVGIPIEVVEDRSWKHAEPYIVPYYRAMTINTSRATCPHTSWTS